MKQIYKTKLILLTSLLFAAILSYSQTTIVFQEKKEPPVPEHIDNPISHGHRMPSIPILGYIDWPTGTINVTNIAEDFNLYQILIDDVCILSTSNQNMAVECLSNIENQCVSVLLYTDHHIYIGFYDPSDK